MKPAWKTSEFWATLISHIVGLVVLSGGLTAEEGNVLGAQLQTIVGSVIVLVSEVVFVKCRSDLKRDTLRCAAEIASQHVQISEETAKDIETTLKCTGV